MWGYLGFSTPRKLDLRVSDNSEHLVWRVVLVAPCLPSALSSPTDLPNGKLQDLKSLGWQKSPKGIFS